MTKTAIVSEASRLGLDVICEQPGDGCIRYTIGYRDAITGGFYDKFHGSAQDVRAFFRGYEVAYRENHFRLEALTQITEHCGPYATAKPAFDYATIGNIARTAITTKPGGK